MKIAIVGAGQVGTSIALGAHRSGFAQNIVLYDNFDDLEENVKIHSLEENAKMPCRVLDKPDVPSELSTVIQANKAIDVVHGTDTLDEFKKALADADIVVLATPIEAFGGVTEAIAPHLKQGVILTDVGSLKKLSIDGITAALKKTGRNDVHYWWSHPGKGTEAQGPNAASANMYDNASVFVGSLGIRASKEEQEPYKTLLQLWKSQGAQAEIIDDRTHDRFFGITSHLQHVLVFSLMDMGHIDRQLRPEYQNAGTALRNTTRVATASAPMWLPVFEGNKLVIAEAASGFKRHFESITASLEKGDLAGIEKILREAHNFRSSLVVKDEMNVPPVLRENILGEIADATGQYDAVQIQPKNAIGLLKGIGDGETFARGTSLPFLIAAASALNAEDVLAKKIDLPRMVNPSFLDGSAPALNDPAFMARLLMANREDVLNVSNQYLERVDTLVEKIKTSDVEYIENLIKNVHALRKQMPLSRRMEKGTESNDPVRQEYLIGSSPTQGEPGLAVRGGGPSFSRGFSRAVM
jgi:cyclohexadieny/prephenate dehydrogenase